MPPLRPFLHLLFSARAPKLRMPCLHSIRPAIPSSRLPQRLPHSLYRLSQPSRSFHAPSRSLFAAPVAPHVSEPTMLSQDDYHRRADAYIDVLVAELEELQESREEVDVEYSAGVLTLVFPPAGTYVLNKQPPNRQIWLSSPTSGPKRYDFVAGAEGKGGWIYLRDGSRLTELLREELGLKFEDVGKAEG